MEDVKALGGEAGVHVIKPGFFGTIGQTEWSNVSFRNREFNDAALATQNRTATRSGGSI